MVEQQGILSWEEGVPPISEAEASEGYRVSMMIVRMWGNVIEPQSKPYYG
ncbi:MAG: hypothetical protein WBI82_08955 [Sphaerochaeta sp.]